MTRLQRTVAGVALAVIVVAGSAVSAMAAGAAPGSTQNPPLAISGPGSSHTANSGTVNSGTLNSGSANSGALNTGTPNTGTPTSGTPNSGTPNSGTVNTGAPNSGTLNSGTGADPAPSAAGSPTPGAGADPVITTYVTYYGWFDNSPPGCDTAFGGCAGGAGTFANPITFATDKAEIPVGTKIYVPAVQKYFVMKDDCVQCDQDWTSRTSDGGPKFRHIDLWIGGKGGNKTDVINCEDSLTQSTSAGKPKQTQVMENPASNLKVSSKPLYNSSTNTCF